MIGKFVITTGLEGEQGTHSHLMQPKAAHARVEAIAGKLVKNALMIATGRGTRLLCGSKPYR